MNHTSDVVVIWGGFGWTFSALQIVRDCAGKSVALLEAHNEIYQGSGSKEWCHWGRVHEWVHFLPAFMQWMLDTLHYCQRWARFWHERYSSCLRENNDWAFLPKKHTDPSKKYDCYATRDKVEELLHLIQDEGSGRSTTFSKVPEHKWNKVFSYEVTTGDVYETHEAVICMHALYKQIMGELTSSNHIDLYTWQEVTGIEDKNWWYKLTTSTGDTFECEYVVISVWTAMKRLINMLDPDLVPKEMSYRLVPLVRCFMEAIVALIWGGYYGLGWHHTNATWFPETWEVIVAGYPTSRSFENNGTLWLPHNWTDWTEADKRDYFENGVKRDSEIFVPWMRNAVYRRTDMWTILARRKSDFWLGGWAHSKQHIAEEIKPGIVMASPDKFTYVGSMAEDVAKLVRNN